MKVLAQTGKIYGAPSIKWDHLINSLKVGIDEVILASMLIGTTHDDDVPGTCKPIVDRI